MKITDIIQEAPITDYQTIGDFSKNSSFRKERDRFLIKNPSTIEYVKKKFNNTLYDIEMYFVNSPAANKHTEVGEVTIDWVEKNLGGDVYNALAKNSDSGAIKIIFTNNKGVEGVPMTAWVMAHRISHVLHRENGWRKDYLPHNTTENQFIDSLGVVADIAYNYGFGHRDILMNRKIQLFVKNLCHEICTFKSARDKNLRDYFEAYNELFAQYMTTGKVVFNDLPKSVKFAGSMVFNKDEPSMYEANTYLHNLATDMEYMFEDVLSYACDRIYVM
jgi:hypothetical protein